MTANLFATHPPSPERLIRADKTLQELQAQGVPSAYFQKPMLTNTSSLANASLGARALSIPSRALNATTGLAGPLLSSATSSFVSSGSSSSIVQQLDEARKKLAQKEHKNQSSADAEEMAQKEAEIQALKKQVQQLEEAKAQDEKEEAENQKKIAGQQLELEKALLEAKEAAKELRYSEFGVLDMGIAKQVTNLWLGKKVTGEQRIFSVQQKKIDWFVQYYPFSFNSWKALAMNHRHYRAYWYSPDGRLYQEQDFLQAKTRADFAKTQLEWDPDLGRKVIGKWMIRIFEDGKLLDERTFEVEKVV